MGYASPIPPPLLTSEEAFLIYATRSGAPGAGPGLARADSWKVWKASGKTTFWMNPIPTSKYYRKPVEINHLGTLVQNCTQKYQKLLDSQGREHIGRSGGEAQDQVVEGRRLL